MDTTTTITLYFDIGSPYSLMALEVLRRYRRRWRFRLRLAPTSNGALLKAAGTASPLASPAKGLVFVVLPCVVLACARGKGHHSRTRQTKTKNKNKKAAHTRRDLERCADHFGVRGGALYAGLPANFGHPATWNTLPVLRLLAAAQVAALVRFFCIFRTARAAEKHDRG